MDFIIAWAWVLVSIRASKVPIILVSPLYLARPVTLSQDSFFYYTYSNLCFMFHKVFLLPNKRDSPYLYLFQ